MLIAAGVEMRLWSVALKNGDAFNWNRIILYRADGERFFVFQGVTMQELEDALSRRHGLGKSALPIDSTNLASIISGSVSVPSGATLRSDTCTRPSSRGLRVESAVARKVR